MTQAQGERICTKERFGSARRSCLRLWEIQGRFQPAPSLAPVPSYVPEPPQGSAQAQSQLAFLLSNQPGQGGSQVPLLPLQAFPPYNLLRSFELRFCLLSKREIIPGMRPLTCCHLSTLTQTFQPILTNGLKHAEAWIPSFLLCLLHEALVDQRGNRMQHISLVIASTLTYRLYRFQCAATDEDREPPEEPLLFALQQVVAPGDGVAQRLLACWHVSGLACQDLQPLTQPSEQCLGWKQFDASRCQLYCQRQSIQAYTDLRHCTRSGRSELEGGQGRTSTLQEEGCRPVLREFLAPGKVSKVRQSQRGDRKLLFSLNMQRGTAGDHHLESRASSKQLCHLWRRGHHLLKVIQDQQDLLVLQKRLYVFNDGLRSALLDPQLVSNDEHYQIRVTD